MTTEEMKLDGWGNVLSGMGKYGRDRKEYTEFAPETKLSESMCRNLYTYSGLAKKVITLPVYDGLRKWFTVEGDTDNAIRGECERLFARKKFSQAWRWARTFGGSMIVVMANDGKLLDEPLDENNIQEIESLKVFQRWRVNRLSDYLDSNHPKYGETEVYNVTPEKMLATPFRVHETRCLIFDGVDVPELVRQENNGWGDPVFQAIYQRLRGLGESYSNVEHIIGEFLLMITKIKGLATKLAANKEQEIVNRAIVNNMTRHVMGSYMIDADGEDATRISATTTGLDKLIDKMMMAVSAESNIPIRRLFGTPITGAGLSNNGESDTRDYYDFVESERYDAIEPQMETFIRLLQLQKKGPFGGREMSNWSTKWNPLYEESMETQLKNRKTQAEIDRSYWEMAALGEEEIRESRFGGETYSFDTKLGKAPEKVEKTVEEEE